MELKSEGFRGERSIVLPHAIQELLARNETTRSLYLTDIGYYPKASGHFRSRPHGAGENILIYCIEGNGWFSVHHKKYSISRNQFFILEKNVPHEYGADRQSPWSIYWVHFSGEKASIFSSIFNQALDIPPVEGHRIQERLSIFEEIYQNLELGYSQDNLEYVSMCLWHLLASFRFVQQFRVTNNVKQMNFVQQTILFMKENLDKNLKLQELAAHVHYSVSHFSLMFAKSTSYSPLEYFNQLKVQRACQYLDHTNLSVKSIAYKLGFNDPFYFSKVFKKHTTLSPYRYKNREK
ncbi:MAG: AraC family transcriptional regulator [Tannerella sp.]|jgi:AraC-like DNA-binding protein/quercetin dioxygenase-like cupin family protein|nr:AraC family transcriptional regulator [Tannerella sp.]